MKLLVLGLLLISASTLYAKRDVDMRNFNQVMIQNIDKTLKDNPQVYETNEQMHRKPASIESEIDSAKQEILEEQSEKLEGFQDQLGQGGQQW